jgi:hypothetical protein
MKQTEPDFRKIRTAEKAFVWTGHSTEDGKRIMGDRSCSCGGRGFVAVGKNFDGTNPTKFLCKCTVKVDLPLLYLIVPKTMLIRK